MAKSPPSAERFVSAHRDASRGETWGIAELAEELGTTARAIRFYEEKGLVSPRREGTTRRYGRRERARLVLVLRGRALGLTLKEMGRYLDLYGERGEGRRQQLELVVERTQEIIDELEAKRATLETTLAEVRLIRRESLAKLRRL